MKLKRYLSGIFVSPLLMAVMASAQTPPAEQAAEMLARAQSVDTKCHYLAATDKMAIAALVARAEQALADREPVEATKAAMQRGHEMGTAATCTTDEKQTVAAILQAAKQATNTDNANPLINGDVTPSPAPSYARAIVQWSEVTPAIQEVPEAQSVADAQPDAAIIILPLHAEFETSTPVAVVKPRVKHLSQTPDASIVATTKQNRHDAPAAPATASTEVANPLTAVKKQIALSKYAKLTQAYYLARRCGVNSGSITSLYQSIVSVHGSLVQNHSAQEISAVLRGAESRAGSTRCS